jgi:beta-N-acetylhexosaminidase
MTVALGPVMLDVQGVQLNARERELLVHPAVGGVILFSRNYEEPGQLESLVAEIHGLRSPALLVAVDHEGGRVQRFREGFTRLPPAAALGKVYDADPARGLQLANEAGWLMAVELRALDIDMSFAPILDLGRNKSQVIGDRAFHRDPDVVTAVARAYVRGMRDAGMAAVGKHFPGHGGVSEDSHHALPVDERRLETFRMEDLVPFERLAADGLPGLMTAHLQVPALDSEPVSFSRRWLSDVLRKQLGYLGAVFSDDISMHGAHGAGPPVERACAALAAGCDVVLVCNDPAAAEAVVQGIGEAEVGSASAVRSSRLARFHGHGHVNRAELETSSRRMQIRRELRALDPEPELDLGDDNPA